MIYTSVSPVSSRVFFRFFSCISSLVTRSTLPLGNPDGILHSLNILILFDAVALPPDKAGQR